MGHNLMYDQMAFVGEEPWHKLGTQLPEGVSAEDMIRAAGLDWEVRKRPAPGAKRQGGDAYNRYVLVRDKQTGETEDVVLGLVTHAYEPFQNREAFRFFDPFIDWKLASFHTAGALGDGERVWVLVKLAEPIFVLGIDQIDRYLLLSNSHDGRGAVSIRFTPIRVVCQNTLNLAAQGGRLVINVSHTRHIARNVAAAQANDLKQIIDATFTAVAELFNALANVKLAPALKERYLESVFPRTRTQRVGNKEPANWQRVDKALQDPTVTAPATRDTLWALYNAVVRVEDYRATREQDAEQRLNRVWFGSGCDLKIRALQQAAGLVKLAA